MKLVVDLDSRFLIFSDAPPVHDEVIIGEVEFVRRGVAQRLPSGTGMLIGVKDWNDPADDLLADASLVRPEADRSPYTFSLDLGTAEMVAKFTAGVTYLDCSIEVEWETSPGSGDYKKTHRKKMRVDAGTIRTGDVSPSPAPTRNDFYVSNGTGLFFNVTAGILPNGSSVSAQTNIALTNNATNYVQINSAGVASANTSGFTDTYSPLAVVVTSGGTITTNTDRRPWIDTKGGGSGGTITTTGALWVDKSGSDANAGILSAPFLTLGAAKTAASSATVHDGPGTYTVTDSILKTGVNWDNAIGVTIAKTNNDTVGILDDKGAAITSAVVGDADLSMTTTVDAVGEYRGVVKVTHASTVLNVSLRTIANSQTAGIVGAVIGVWGAAGVTIAKATKSISGADTSTNEAGIGVYWTNGTLKAEAPDIFGTNVAVWSHCDDAPTGDLFANARDFYATQTTSTGSPAVIFESGTNASAAAWIVGSTIRSPGGLIAAVWSDGASKLYASTQKNFGASRCMGTGILFVQTMKSAAVVNGTSSWASLVQTAGGTHRITSQTFDPVTFSGVMIKTTGGTTYFNTSDYIANSGSNGLEFTGGTVFLCNMVIDTSANSGTDAITVSGATVYVINCHVRSHASRKDIVQSSGTVTVTYGSGSGTNGAFTTTGTVGKTKPDTALLADTATALATGRTISASGDATGTSGSFDGTGNSTIPLTLATVASAGTTGSSTAIPVVTINAKGLTTGITAAAVVAPAGTLTGTTLAANVVTSSLTAVGTITIGVWNAGNVTSSSIVSAANQLFVGTASTSNGVLFFYNASGAGYAAVVTPASALGNYNITLPNAASTLPIYGQQITHAGFTSARTITWPDASITVARTDAGNTFTGTQTITTIDGLTTVTGTGAMSLTGGAGNWTQTAGTGNSRTMTFRTTTSGGTATTALTLGADQTATFIDGTYTSGSVCLPSVHGTTDAATGFAFRSGIVDILNNSAFRRFSISLDGFGVHTMGGTSNIANVNMTGALGVPNATYFGFYDSGAWDTRLSRNAAGVFSFDTSTTGNGLGSIIAARVSLGGAAAAATTTSKITKAVASIADNTATTVLTITIPNSAQSGSVNVTLVGALGAGGTIGAREATATITYDISITRTAGVLAVATLSTGYGSAASAVAGADTVAVTGTIAHGGEAVGATNTYLVKVTIAKGGGASANHTCQVVAEVANAAATGISIA